jgi:hypothetical protein
MAENLVKTMLALALAWVLSGCATTPAAHRGKKAGGSNAAILIGAGLGAVLLGTTTAISVAGMRESEEKQVGLYLGIPLMAGLGAGLGGFLGWALDKPYDPDAGDGAAARRSAQALPESREYNLAKARQYEADGQWAQAWGAYRKAKDLGPRSDLIEEKIKWIEMKLGVQPEP